MNRSLVDYIGKPALLEQTAEECLELGFACLKYARYLRGENKVHGRTENEMISSLHEEIADLYICLGELHKAKIIDPFLVDDWDDKKRKRMIDRLKEEK